MFTRFLALALLCCTFTSRAATLVDANETWRFQRGTNEASSPDTTAWRGLGFDDAAFVDAPAPFWYGDVRTGGTQLTDMQNVYTCIFLRKTVSVTGASQIGGLRLRYFVDDGFVVWVNGTEVYREGVTGEPTVATLAANQATDPAPLVSVTVPIAAGVLREGANVIAIQAFNTSAASSDFGIDCAVESLVTETVPPTLVSFTPAAGARTELTQITVVFSEPVTGVDADDLAVAGNPPTSVTGSGTTYTFTFPQPTPGVVPITWETSHGITDLAAIPNPFNAIAPGATWSYTLLDVVAPTVADRFPEAGSTVSALGQVEIRFSEPVTGVDAADLRVNGQPATNVIAQPNSVYVFQFAQPASGTVQFQFGAGHGIKDQAVPPNDFAGAAWSCVLDTSAGQGDLVITEINASNQSGLRDEDGEEQDWIEIYNRGSAPADLAGWSLSDDAELPGQWTFPARVLLPNQYLVVFASGKNRKTPTGTNRFHVNFTLANDGEFLGLFDAASPRRLVSSFGAKYPTQRNDYSYGPDAAGNLRYFAVPTPGAPNGSSATTGVVEPVHFSASRGHYTQPFDLVLSCPTPGSIIRFTTDGSEPTEVNGRVYATPLRLTNTTLLRASAFRTGLLVSKVTSHSFFFGLTPANRALPTLSILTHSNNLLGRTGIIGMSGGTGPPNNAWTATGPNDYYNPTNKGIEWEKPASVEYIDPVDNSGFQIDAGLRVQGSDWTRPRYTPSSKFSYRLYFRGDYGSGRLNYPLLPTAVVNSFDQIVLRAGHNDETNPYITDELMRQLFADQGQVSVHGTFVNFWLNGVLKLYYNPTERVEEGFLQSWHGGGKNWDIITVGSAVQGGDDVAWNSLRSYVSGQNAQLPSVYQEIERRMDVTNFVDYLIVNTYGATWDWPHNNWRAARERSATGRFRFYVWDAEGAFGFTRSTPTFDSFSTSDSGLLPPSGTAEIPRLYQGLRVSPEFRLLWADRVQKHFFNNGALTDTNITKRFLELRAKVLPVINGFNNAYLTSWIPQRRAPLMSQYVLYGLAASSNAPIFSQHGGPVPPGYNLSMAAGTNGVGTVYYTLDGSDPRVKFTGAIAPGAVAYGAPVTLNQAALVKARSLVGTNWSAMTEATFEVGSQGSPLRISEINYNPPGGSVHEFIELQNVSAAPVDLSGCYFDEGIAFTFSAGASIGGSARMILANNTDTNAFAIRYPGVAVGGYFAGNLNNAGERLTLRTPTGQILLSVDFKDSGGWPTAADGAGATLELLSPYGDPDDAANWIASSSAGGTPGAAAAPPASSPIRLSEIMAENLGAVNNAGTVPDWIELQNTSGAPVNVAGWSVSDEGNARKYVLPAGTTIPAGGFLVLWCDRVTNASPGLHTGFSLERSGDCVFLYDPATNRLDAVCFGPQLANRTLGLAGGEWQLNDPTPNAANQAAAVAPVSALSINEWMANAAPGLPDWIELYNSSDLPVALKGCYLGTTNLVHRISSLSFIAGKGFIQLIADEGVGPDHLDLKLPAAASPIVLYSPAGPEIDRVSYTNALEGVTRGRLPDGAANFVNFPGSASPGASNFVNGYAGPIVNEVLARNVSAVTNAGSSPDYVELFNPGAAPFSLDGMSLSVNSPRPGQWIFPSATSIPAGGYLVIWCDSSRPASTTAGSWNTGESLEGDTGGVYLFNAAGQLVNSVDYGFQVADRPIGLSGGSWRLLSAATPGAPNAAAASLGSIAALRLNEWMADPANGPDWFEVYNSTNLPVDLNGVTLSDDPSIAGFTQFRAAPLSFAGPNGFIQWIADGNPDAGRNHVSFSLDAGGDSLRLYSTNGTNFVLVDAIAFGQQLLGVSEGRLLDGEATFAAFPGSATPGAPNAVLEPSLVISEVLTHTDAPLEDAVELFNRGSSPVNVGGWFLSNSRDNLKKFRLPDNTVVPAGGHVVFYQYQFGGGSPTSFTLNSAHGDEVWLSAADAVTGRLTGARTGARFGAAANGVSFGRVETTAGVEYAPLTTLSFGTSVGAGDPPGLLATFRTGTGAANSAPRVGPLVINEVLYNPVSGAEEYVEVRNLTGAAVDLYDPAFPLNRWRLAGGIDFTFPANTSLAANGFLLVVEFDPVANPAALAAFRARYGISAAIPVFGPFAGKLSNDGDSIELLRPDRPQGPEAPDAGFVPYLTVDRINYADAAPWPSGPVDGGGLSLQRKTGSAYGNEPLNWIAALPTPGTANGAGVVPPPTITAPPQNVTVFEGATPVLSVSANGAGPLSYQWRLNGTKLPDATNSSYALDYVVDANEGIYDVLVSNAGGVSVGGPASLRVTVPPIVLVPPASLILRPGSNAVFSVAVRGDAPLRYQWRFKGLILPGETNATLVRNGIQFADDGVYDVVVSNPVASTVASATLTVLVNPAIVVAPVPQTIVAGGAVTLSVMVSGNPLPFSFEWRRGSLPLITNTLNRAYDFYTFSTNAPGTYSFRVVVRNLANNNPGVASAQIPVTVVADTDGDGLPDYWETAYGLDPASNADRNLDTDGDGVSNYAEYIAGTDPASASSYLRVELSTVPGSATVSFNAISNKTYTVRYTDALGSGEWSRLRDVIGLSTNRNESILDPAWTTNRFYQLVTPAQP